MSRYDNDIATTDYYNRSRRACDHGNPFSSVFDFSSRETDAEVYSVSWKSPSIRSIRASDYLLPEECQSVYGESWNSGNDFNSSGRIASSLEAEYADFNSWWNGLLYAFNSDAVWKWDLNEDNFSVIEMVKNCYLSKSRADTAEWSGNTYRCNC